MKMKFTPSEPIAIDTTTVYEEILSDLNAAVELEVHKYPLTDREKLFVDILQRTLTALDASCRWRYR